MNELMINQLHFLMIFFFLSKAIFRINSKKNKSCCTFSKHAETGSILFLQEIFLLLNNADTIIFNSAF